MNRSLSKLLTLLGVIALSSALLPAVHAQSPRSRETVVQSIKSRATQDADAESPRATPQDLSILFGKEAEAVGLTMQEVMDSYNEAYLAAQQRQPWWKAVVPKAGWIVAGILLFLLIIQEAFRKAVSEAIDKILRKIYRRAAGYRIFQQKALRNYKKALIEKYQFFKIPFRSDRDLDMTKIYIPLKIKGNSDADLIDESDLLESFKWMVVIGAPGSGKSMLLKRIALSSAFNNIRNDNRTPVLIDLRRFNEGDKSLIEHLIAIMELNDFPNAGAYIEASLSTGSLLLLFDGLDEVANIRQGDEPTKREIAVRKIIDLLDTYEKCPAIITCRTAVYRRDFDDIAQRTLEIVEFSDQQIQNFLMSWPEPPSDKPIEQLIASLSERPAILALARNPLLLTIVAFLYTDMAEFQLPYSRTEFYTQAVDVLLQQLKGGLNRYRLAPKLLVLEHLALFNQEKDQTVTDRLTIDEATVLKLINQLLPSLSLDPKDVTPLLEEIVERSNLLLEVDNKTKYQFFHLTLQEFFAATALRNDSTKLLANFQANKDAWRETIKLWCGLPHDSTQLIQAVFKIDPLTAFECLADAPRVEQTTADTIINHYKPLLGAYGERSEAITKAFAGVAAGRSQRGGAVLSFLMNELNTTKNSRVRKAAAEALALSNKQDAVICLSNRYDSDSAIVRPAIIKMGNIAVTSLKRLAENGHLAAINALHSIGTTKGIMALVSLLWHQEEHIQRFTALKLAQTVSQRNGLESLREYSLSPREKAQPWYDWVWSPFGDSSGSSVPVIIGRIAYLLDTFKDQTQPVDPVEADWRIVVPLILKERENAKVDLHVALGALPASKLEEIFSPYVVVGGADGAEAIARFAGENRYLREIYVERYFNEIANSLTVSNQQITVKPILNGLGAPDKMTFLVGLMSPKTQFTFMSCLLNKTQPFLDRWQYIRRPKKPLPRFWPYSLLLLLVLVLSLISVREFTTVLQQPQRLVTWSGLLSVYLVISIAGGWALTAFGLGDDSYDNFYVSNLIIALISFLYPAVLVLDISNLIRGKALEFSRIEHIQLFFSSGFAVALTYVCTLHLMRYFSGKFIVLFWVSIAVFVLVTAWAVARHISRYDNPLRKFAVGL
jgi:hypothetical protein